jgi:transposase
LVNEVVRNLRNNGFRKEAFSHVDARLFSVTRTVRLGIQDGRAFQLTDEQWFLIEELFPWNHPQRVGGRPPIPPRPCLEVLLWFFRNGGRWQDLQSLGGEVPSESTLRRRLAEWVAKGILTEVWSRLADLADELGGLDWSQLIADGTFCPAKKGANWSPRDSKGPAPRLSC